MNTYELTVVLPGDTTPAKKKTASELIAKLVKVLDGKVVKEEDWGKKELAYPINKITSGVYVHYLVKLLPETVKQLENKLVLDDSILRHLIVRAK